jgi:hypothetical protein
MWVGAGRIPGICQSGSLQRLTWDAPWAECPSGTRNIRFPTLGPLLRKFGHGTALHPGPVTELNPDPARSPAGLHPGPGTAVHPGPGTALHPGPGTALHPGPQPRRPGAAPRSATTLRFQHSNIHPACARA